MTIHSEHLKLDKWVSALNERSSVQQAASYSLQDRLTYLQQVFPCAAKSKTESTEDVHQLRVATRRIFAAIELYAELLPTKRTKSLQRSLKTIQRASGAVRDLDVLAKRYRKVEHKNAKKLLKALGRRRSKKQRRLVKLYHRLQSGDRLLNQAEKLLAKIGRPGDFNEVLVTWMKQRWLKLVELFFQSADVDSNDLKALHRFRISSKQLRYGLELLSPAFDLNQRERANEFVERLQDRLGQLHDHVIARDLFSDWNSKRNRISKRCDLKRMIDDETEMLQKQCTDFAVWWTPAMKADMRQAFDQLAT